MHVDYLININHVNFSYSFIISYHYTVKINITYLNSLSEDKYQN